MPRPLCLLSWYCDFCCTLPACPALAAAHATPCLPSQLLLLIMPHLLCLLSWCRDLCRTLPVRPALAAAPACSAQAAVCAVLPLPTQLLLLVLPGYYMLSYLSPLGIRKHTRPYLKHFLLLSNPDSFKYRVLAGGHPAGLSCCLLTGFHHPPSHQNCLTPLLLHACLVTPLGATGCREREPHPVGVSSRTVCYILISAHPCALFVLFCFPFL